MLFGFPAGFAHHHVMITHFLVKIPDSILVSVDHLTTILTKPIIFRIQLSKFTIPLTLKNSTLLFQDSLLDLLLLLYYLISLSSLII